MVAKHLQQGQSVPMTPSPSRRRIRVVAAALVELKTGKVLLVRRPPWDQGGGLWEFPGGKIEEGESPKQALLREMDEELGIGVNVLQDLGWGFHAYEQTDIDINVMICEINKGPFILKEHDASEWMNPEDLGSKELLAADKPFVQRVQEWMRANKK